MKKKISFLTLMFLASVAFTQTETFIGEANFIDITIPQSSTILSVAYPGGVGGCGIQFRLPYAWSNKALAQKVVDAIKFDISDLSSGWNSLAPEIESTGLITYRFPKNILGAFKTWVKIETASGKPLDEVIYGVIYPPGQSHLRGAIINGISCH